MIFVKIALYVFAFIMVFFFLFAVFTIICSNLIDTSREYDENSVFYRFLLNFWTWFMIGIMRIKIDSKGLEKVPEDGRFVIVSNHRSNFDPIITWYLLKKDRLAYITKPENYNVPFFGKIIRKCCFSAIDRDNPKNALKTVERAANLIKKDEVSIGVYPEGTRNKTDDVLLPFHNGVFKIAKKAGVPLVIASIKGTPEISENFPWHKTKVSFEVLDVIGPEKLLSMSDSEIGNNVKEMLENSLKAA